MYKQALASFWTVDEVDLSNDLRDWQKLTGGGVGAVMGTVVGMQLMQKFGIEMQQQLCENQDELLCMTVCATPQWVRGWQKLTGVVACQRMNAVGVRQQHQ
jgi:hypothetical protein